MYRRSINLRRCGTVPGSGCGAALVGPIIYAGSVGPLLHLSFVSQSRLLEVQSSFSLLLDLRVTIRQTGFSSRLEIQCIVCFAKKK